MDEPREREQLLVLVDVNVCREDGDQQGDNAPGSEPGIPWHKQQNAEDDLDHSAHQDEGQVKRQVRRHELQEEVGGNEMADACGDEQCSEGPLADEIPELPSICDPCGVQLRSSPVTIPPMISINTPNPTPRA